ncbi:MAG: hypothetical protein KDA61_01515, partial [Planctomycetales bacterium]|nr:hypothetical protein [Planctomycetales bacterium]
MFDAITRAVVCLALACVGAYVGGRLADRQFALFPEVSGRTADASFAQPRPEYDPHDVVKLQLEALAKASTDKHAIGQCYAFASPQNRQQVGSLDHFEHLLQNPLYRPLLNHSAALVGKALIAKETATVLATVVDRG